MSFEEEWAGLRTEAEVRMQLAHTDGGPSWSAGSGRGDLKTDTSSWNTASSGVGDVRGNLNAALSTLSDRQRGAGTGDPGVVGFASTGSQAALYRSWKTQLNLLGRECGELADKLAKAGNDHYKNEQAIADAFRETRTEPIDPPPGG